jgi:uncharacterized membrane protein YqjE
MSDINEQAGVSADDEARQRPLMDDLRALADGGMALAKAEIDLQKARGQYAAGRVKSIVLFGALAAVFVCLALVALTVGMVIALTPIIGAIGATLSVFAALLIVAFVCVLTASGRWKQMVRTLSNPPSPAPGAPGSDTGR